MTFERVCDARRDCFGSKTGSYPKQQAPTVMLLWCPQHNMLSIEVDNGTLVVYSFPGFMVMFHIGCVVAAACCKKKFRTSNSTNSVFEHII
jgi:hypothetical protein